MNALDDRSPPKSAPRLSWQTPLGLIPLSFINFILRILTLGIYDFWARTEVRKRVWSAIRLSGEPLAYQGTGRELFVGFLIIFFIILLPIILFSFAAVALLGPKSPLLPAFNMTLYAVIFFLIGVGLYRAQRYRLSRTSWRGIRGALTGNSWHYGATYFWTALLIPLTAGWISPWRSTKLQKLIVNEMKFGSAPFSFNGTSGPLYKAFAVLWFFSLIIIFTLLSIAGALFARHLNIFSLGDLERAPPTEELFKAALIIYGLIAVGFLLYAIISAWYRARMINYFASCTHYHGLKFRGTAQARGLIYIAVTNFIIRLLGSILVLVVAAAVIGLVLFALLPQLGTEGTLPILQGLTPAIVILAILSFSLFAPITQSRNTGYLIEHLQIEGETSLSDISQATTQQIQTGEGLAQAFDVDGF